MENFFEIGYHIGSIYDILNEEENSDNENEGKELQTLDKFGLRLFGLTPENKTICCTVTNYFPYFFIKLDKGYENSAKNIVDKITETVYPKQCISGFKGYRLVDKYDFSEFSNFTKFKNYFCR